MSADPGFGVGRPPCSGPPNSYGWPASPVRATGSCYQHARASDKNIPAYDNVTKVTDWHCPPSGVISGSGCCDGSCAPDPLYNAAGISPYARIQHVTDCNGTTYWCTEAPGQVWCGAWRGAFGAEPAGWLACAGGDTQVDYNCFHPTGSTVDLSLCRKLGFKSLQWWKSWHGKFGYFSHDNIHSELSLIRNVSVGTITQNWTGSDAIGWTYTGETDGTTLLCNGIDLEWEQVSPDSTRYLVESISVSYTSTDSGPGSVSGSGSVNRYSGVMTAGCSSSGSAGAQTAIMAILLDNGSTGGSVGVINGLDALGLMLSNAITGIAPFIPATFDTSCTVSGQAVTYTATNSPHNGYYPDGATYMTITVDLAAGTLSWKQYGYALDGTTWEIVRDEEITVSNTGVTHTITGKTFSGGTEHDMSWSCTQTLSGPYTGSDVNTDFQTLRSHWDLSDDHIYPWRTDALLGVAPLIHYDEVFGTVEPNATVRFDSSLICVDWTDPVAGTYSGNVVGAPVGIAGLTRGYFDWDHRLWRCCCGDGGVPDTYVYGIGAYAGEINEFDATSSVIPKNATCWTENLSGAVIDGGACLAACEDGWGVGFARGYNSAAIGQLFTPFPCAYHPGSLPPGGWRIYAPNGVLYGQDWAEIKIPRPSVNFARPYGPDRYALDETTVRCIQTGSTSSSVTIDSSTTINSGDKVWVCGAAGIADGLYSATKNSATNYSLSPLAFAPGYTYPNDCNGFSANGIIGKLRWPTAPAIGGRIAIQAVDPTGIVTTAAATQLATGDQVDIAGCLGNTAINGSAITVTVIDDTHFSTGIAQSPGAYTGSGYVTSHGAPDYSWCDDRGRGQFGYAVWTMNVRDYQERARVIDQYAAAGDCSDALPANTSQIRQYQFNYHGLPQAVTDLTITQECLPFSVCDPQCLVISGNASESWTNAVVNAPPALTLDGRYGAMWQAAIIQEVNDPFWETPHKPCVTCSEQQIPTSACWGPDDGNCETDSAVDDCIPCPASGNRFYPFSPQVEFLAAAPVGAPTLPSDVYVGYLTQADLNTSSAVHGNVFVPPQGQGYTSPDSNHDARPLDALPPWLSYWYQMNCTCTNGRFSQQYQDNGVKVHCP